MGPRDAATPHYTTRLEPLGTDDRGVTRAELGVLLVILAACALPMWINLGLRDTTHTMENLAVFSSQETWLRQHGWHDIPAEPRAWAMPSRNGEPRLRKPPGVVWANLLAWADLRPGDANATPDDLLYRARLVSVAMGLVLMAGVYGIGRQLGDRRTAWLAALVAGTMIFTQKQARYASYDIYMAAWLAAAWAAVPMRSLFAFGPSRAWRDAGRWGFAGAALGVAWMCKGPLALAVFAVMLAGVAAAARSGRGLRRLAWGLPLAIGVAGVIALPWYAWAAMHYPLGEAIFAEAAHVQQRSSPPWFYLGLLGLVFPWTVFLIGGLCLPWMRLDGSRRRQALAAWWAFVFIVVMFTIPSAKQQRYILPIVPAAAVLIAQLWRWHRELAAAGEDDPGGAALRWPHAVLLIGGAIWFGPFALWQEQLVAWGVLEQPEIDASDATLGVVAVSLFMLVAGVMVARHTLTRNKRPAAAAAWTAAWMIAFSTAWWAAYSAAPDGIHPTRQPARLVADLTAGYPVRGLITDDLDEGINEELLFYSQRVMPELDPAALRRFTDAARHAGEIAFVVAPVGEPRDALLHDLGYTPRFTFTEDHDRRATLWQLPPHQAAP